MSIIIPDRFGYLSPDCATQGAPGSSALIREIIKNNNRLIARPSVVDSLIVPTTDSTTDFADGLFRGYGFADWSLIRGPIAIRKKPGTTKLMSGIYLRVEGSAPTGIQICTSKKPFNPTLPLAAAENVVYVAAPSGGWQSFEIEDIPCGDGESELLSFYIRGISTTLMSGSLGANTGTAEAGADNVNRLYLTGAGWMAGIINGNYISWDDHPSIDPRIPVSLISTTELEFFPPLPRGFDPVGEDFTIYSRGLWHVGSAITYTMAREV
jgi:hypothetical protein